MKYLEERDIGFDVGVTKVPLVVQSCIFDLVIGDKNARPDGKWHTRLVRTLLMIPFTGKLWSRNGRNSRQIYGA